MESINTGGAVRIALRTSGGRGEFELAGTQERVGVSDMLNLALTLELSPGLELPTGNVARRMQGKPRIRLEDKKRYRHLYLLLGEALLLPKPVREVGATPPGKMQLVDSKFSIGSIQFDVLAIRERDVLIRPTELILINSGYLADHSLVDSANITVVERLAALKAVWSLARDGSGPIHDLLRRHELALRRGDWSALGLVAKELRDLAHDGSDPLRFCVQTIDPRNPVYLTMGMHKRADEAEVDDNPQPVSIARVARVRVWRQIASRGRAGEVFSETIKELYRNTCVITGHRLPFVEAIGSPGVESAHILPWADYQLNHPTNGLCLTKHCHWAFDSGVLKLSFDQTVSRYVVSIGANAQRAHQSGLIDLAPFIAMAGPIETQRLPRDKANWPNPAFLTEFNRSFEF